MTGTKARLLFLTTLLLEHTDDEHMITTEDLLRIYREHGFKCQRTTIPDDIAALRSAGIDVIQEQVPRNESSMNAYHIGNRLFELAELRMLVDAVSSSRFITKEKSDQLILKLSQMTNAESRDSLTARIYTEDRLKTSNPNIFVNMDVIRKAIDDGRKISFHYWNYTPTKERILRNDGEEYIASPYALIWNDDRYYIAAWSDKREKIVKYRVDRMCDVKELYIPAVRSENFNAALYSRSVIKMFDGDLEETTVTLRCENDLMQHVLDRFGEDTETEIADPEHFIARIRVTPSSTFFGWVMQYQGGLLIEGPEEVRAAYEGMLRDILAKQEKLD